MNPIRRGIVLVLAALATVVWGCGSTGTEGSGGSGGPAGNGGSSVAGSSGVGMQVGRGDEFGPAARSKMNAGWDAFKKDSPDWPRLREQWVGLGPRATNTLVENLFRAMVLSRLKNYPEGYDRSRLELIKLGELAVPTLSGVLDDPYFRDTNTGRRVPLTTGIVTDVADVLTLAAPASVGPLTRLTRSSNLGVRRACMLALGRTRHSDAVSVLSDRLDASSWLDRTAAAKALGYTGSDRAVGPLVDALGDRDKEVVKEAASALARLKARGALGALESRRDSARSAGQHDVAASCGAAAQAIRSGR